MALVQSRNLICVESRVKTLPDVEEALDQLREMPFLDLDLCKTSGAFLKQFTITIGHNFLNDSAHSQP
jgi:hypothetical protein